MHNLVTPFTGFYAETYRQLHAEGPDADLSALDARQASMPPGESHWEFAAIALLHVATREGQAPPCAIRAQLDQWQSKFNPKHPAGNWRLMRVIVNAAFMAWPLDHEMLTEALGPLGVDGHLPDVQGEVSSQYHAYNLLLLARFGDALDPKVCSAVREGFAWLFEVDRTYGDPSPLGRGRFQTFGYAAMQAAAQYAGGYGVEVPGAWAARVAIRLSGVVPGSGALPPFWDGPYRQELLHGYNTVDDYPAFAEFWAPHRETPALPAAPAPDTQFVLKEDWGTLVYDNSQGPALYLPHATPRQRPGKLSRLLVRAGLRAAPAPARPVRIGATEPCSVELTGDVHQCIWARPGAVAAPPAAQVLAGSPERSSMDWTGPTGTVWVGQDIRMVRRGSLSVSLGLKLPLPPS
jgi:hypothetical protein